MKQAELQSTDDLAKAYLIEKARKNLMHFTIATKPNFHINWHHKVWCHAMHMWIKGVWPYLILEGPPRHGKTEIVSRRAPPFILGRDPNANILSTSAGDDLARQNNRDVQRIIDTPLYRQIFPGVELKPLRGAGPDTSKYVRNSQEFEIVNHHGFYRGASVGGNIIGRGANYLIVDDPIKGRKQADSPKYREDLWNWWVDVAYQRLEGDGRALIMHTRWHEADLVGRLLDQMKNGDEFSLPWVRIRLPAVYEDGDADNPPCDDDPRAVGDALWSWKYDAQRLKEIKANINTRSWEAQYQQRPTAQEGGIIKKKWITDNQYKELPPKFSRMLQSWDLNFREGLANDFVVGTVWGVFNGDFYLVDMFRERIGFVDTCDNFKLMSKQWPQAFTKLIERKANGDALISSMKRENIIGLVPIDPDVSKEARLWAAEPLFRAGNVKFPHESIAPWVKDAIAEVVKFPNGMHDDIVDTVSQALNYLALGKGDVLDKMTRR